MGDVCECVCGVGGGGEKKLASLQESGPTKETEEEQTEILRVMDDV